MRQTTGQLKVKQSDRLCSGCERNPAHSKGLCNACYIRARSLAKKTEAREPIRCTSCKAFVTGRITGGVCSKCYYKFPPGADQSHGVDCTECQERVPRFFSAGLCKGCGNNKKDKPPRKLLPGGICTDCHEPFLKLMATGRCQPCASRRKYLAEREKRLAVNATWKAGHKEERALYSQQWHADNKDYMKEKRRAEYLDCPEKFEKYKNAVHPLKQRDYGLKNKYGEMILRYRNENPTVFDSGHSSADHGPYIEFYFLLLRHQGGKCANPRCSTRHTEEELLVVDHCHASSTIRGLLCGPCNRAAGQLGDDHEKTVGLAEYLKGHTPSLKQVAATHVDPNLVECQP